MSAYRQPIQVDAGRGVSRLALTQLRRLWDEALAYVPVATADVTSLRLLTHYAQSGHYKWNPQGLNEVRLDSPRFIEADDFKVGGEPPDLGALDNREGIVETELDTSVQYPRAPTVLNPWMALIHELTHIQAMEAAMLMPGYFVQRQADELARVMGVKSIFMDDAPPLEERLISAAVRHDVAEELGYYAVQRRYVKHCTFGEFWPIIGELEVGAPASSSRILPAMRPIRDEVNAAIERNSQKLLYARLNQPFDAKILTTLVQSRFDL